MDFYLEWSSLYLACSIIMMVSDKAQHMLEIEFVYKVAKLTVHTSSEEKTELDPSKNSQELKTDPDVQAEDSMHILRKDKGCLWNHDIVYRRIPSFFCMRYKRKGPSVGVNFGFIQDGRPADI